VIEDFSCKETEKISNGGRSKRLPGEIQERAFLRLRQLHAADILEDLRIPPSNRLRWNDGKASDVRITDYH
jgi:proteic killer suppression protein